MRNRDLSDKDPEKTPGQTDLDSNIKIPEDMKPKIDNPEESTSPENKEPKNKYLSTKGEVCRQVSVVR